MKSRLIYIIPSHLYNPVSSVQSSLICTIPSYLYNPVFLTIPRCISCLSPNRLFRYIKVDWKKVEKTKKEVTKDLQANVGAYVPKFIDESKALAAQNVYLASGFAGGFLLGVAST